MLVAASVASLALVTTACGSGAMRSSAQDQDGAGQGGAATGNAYVDGRGCPRCHQGPDPQTTGSMSGSVAPIPGNFGSDVVLYGPNLTPDPTTGLGDWSDDQIATAIIYGIDNQGERLCPQMQHFPDMPMTELQSILGYLRSLEPVVHGPRRADAPAEEFEDFSCSMPPSLLVGAHHDPDRGAGVRVLERHRVPRLEWRWRR